MVKSGQLSPGMVISIGKKIFRVESSVKVSMARGVPFIKTSLKNLMSEEIVEKNFKPDQEVEDVKLAESRLEYLYPEGKLHHFLDIDSLDQVNVEQAVIGDKMNFLKEGIQLKAMQYGGAIFSIDLPQFLELMVVKTEDLDAKHSHGGQNKAAILETGARIEVPLFIESGDVVKVDTALSEFVQRV